MKNDKDNKFESQELRATDDAVRLIKILMEDDNLSPALRVKIQAWLLSDDDNEHKQRAFDEYVSSIPLHEGGLDGELRDSYNRLAVRMGLTPVRDNDAPTVRRRIHRFYPRVAVACAAVLAVVCVWFALNNPFADTGMSIARSEQYQTAFLPDSSHVSVNPRSSVEYNDTDGVRTADLSGEAFFKVRRDEARPFVVATTHLKVNVLGTEFSVREFPEDARSTVSLFEGSINVETGEQTMHLTRGERLEYDHTSGVVSVVPIDPYEMAEKGYKPRLKFDGATFREVLDALEMYHGIEITVTPGMDVSGGNLIADFEGRPLDDALELLLRTGGDRWAYSRSDDSILVYVK